jgi:hypothetical protein
MRSKTLQFVCLECKSEVFRLGSKVDKTALLCGKCNTNKPQKDPCLFNPDYQEKSVQESVKVAQNVIGIASESESTDVLAALTGYRNRLNKVESLMVQYPQETFLQLWERTKQ